jgi:NAD(P)H-nitrite reductase large subunit
MRRYVIIGAGAAGISAAESIRAQDATGKILMLSEEADGYYSRPGLAYYLTGEIPEGHLYPMKEDDLARLGVHLKHQHVIGISPDEHRLKFNNDKSTTYDQLLIATGANAFRIRLPGVELEGVVKLDSVDDARKIRKLSRRARNAVVVGGGITALELVEGLRARGVRVHYILRGDRYWSNVLDESESRIVEGRLEEEGVNIHFNTELAEILGKRGKVMGVKTKDGRQIKCHMVAIAIGVQPRKELAEVAGLETDRGILVDEYLRSSEDDIYAAGDVAQVFDPVSGLYIVDSLWNPARQQGRVAGLNMTGDQVPYCKGIAFNVTRLAGLTTTIIGVVGRRELDPDLVSIARGDSETFRQLPDAIAAQSEFEINRLRLMVGEKYVVGAIVMGDQTLSQPIHHMVVNQVDISSIRDRLLQPSAKIDQVICEFWENWSRENAAKQS